MEYLLRGLVLLILCFYLTWFGGQMRHCYPENCQHRLQKTVEIREGFVFFGGWGACRVC